MITASVSDKGLHHNVLGTISMITISDLVVEIWRFEIRKKNFIWVANQY